MPTPLEDKFAIEERIAIYNHTLDQGHFAEFLACWCEDGVFEGLAGMGGPFIGKAAIKTFTDSYEARVIRRFSGLKHFTVNIASKIDGDRATSVSNLQLVMTGAKGVQILSTGRYHDTLRRVDAQWLFERRRLDQDLPPPAAPPSTTQA